MTHDTRGANWHMRLVDAIEKAENGDTIKVSSVSARDLAQTALARMCPGKALGFEVEELSSPFEGAS